MSQVEAAGRIWRVMRGQSLAYRCWDDEAVLYNDLSGATHLLGPAALCVLETLRANPVSEAELASSLLDEFDMDGDTLTGELTSLLDELSQLSLIEPLPC